MVTSPRVRTAISTFAGIAILAGCRGSQPIGALPAANPAVGVAYEARNAQPGLSCSPTPCVLPIVQTSPKRKLAMETAISVNPRDRQQLLAASNEQACGPGHGWIAVGMNASSDGGKTWNHACLKLAKNATADAVDPSVGYDLNGTAFVSGQEAVGPTNEWVVQKSANNGRSWSDPVILPTYNTNAVVDKGWLEVDTSPSSPRKNDLYVSVDEFYGAGQTQMTVASSDDGGTKWTVVPVGPSYAPPTQILASNNAIGKDGTIYVTAEVCTVAGAPPSCGVLTDYLFKSSDGGKTWSSGSVVDTPTVAPNTCGCQPFGSLPHTKEKMVDLATVAVDNSDGARTGTIYVTDFTWANDHSKVRLISSSDGGTTWSKPRYLAPKADKHDQFFPWVSVSSSGVVGVTWLDRRNNPQDVLYQEYGAVSSDGVHFTEYRIAGKASDPRDGQRGHYGPFMGDYTGNAWGGKKLYATWPDTTEKPGDTMRQVVGGLEVP